MKHYHYLIIAFNKKPVSRIKKSFYNIINKPINDITDSVEMNIIGEDNMKALKKAQEICITQHYKIIKIVECDIPEGDHADVIKLQTSILEKQGRTIDAQILRDQDYEMNRDIQQELWLAQLGEIKGKSKKKIQ